MPGCGGMNRCGILRRGRRHVSRSEDRCRRLIGDMHGDIACQCAIDDRDDIPVCGGIRPAGAIIPRGVLQLMPCAKPGGTPHIRVV